MAVFVGVVWNHFQVPLSAMVRFVAYEAAYVVAPGTLAYVLLTGARRVGARQLAVGWALGYALEIAAFCATAAVSARGAFSFYPIVTAILALLAALRWRRDSERRGAQSDPVDAARTGGSVWPWLLAIVMLILVAYMASGYYTSTPLPWTIHGPVSYDQDHVWELSLVGEALRTFPLQIPNLSGITLHYHYFAYLDLAAVAQVTHLAVPMVVFRLYVVPLIVVACLELFVLGRRLGGGRSSVGIVTVVLAFLVGPFDPWPQPPSEFITHFYEGPSASYAIGLVLLLAVTIELTERFSPSRGLVRSPGPGAAFRHGAGSWLVLAVLAAACGGAKVVILPMLLGSLAIAAIYSWFIDRGPLRAIVETIMLVFGLLVTSFAVLYSGASQPINIRPFAEIDSLQPFAYLRAQTSGFLPSEALVTAIGVIVETFKALLGLVAGFTVIAAQRRRPPVVIVWLLALLLVGLVADMVYYDPHDSQVYFLYYGYVPAAGVAAVGLRELWAGIAPRVTVSRRMAGAIIAAALMTWVAEGPIGSRPGQPVEPLFWASFSGVQVPSTNYNLTPGLYAGLSWVRLHTPAGAVLAVNNRWQDGGYDARYCYYSAFAQRSVMLECDIGTSHIDQYLDLNDALAKPTSGPYPTRTSLTTGIFHYGNRGALDIAVRRFHVSYLVLDLVHLDESNPPAVKRLGKVVFADGSVVVVKV